MSRPNKRQQSHTDCSQQSAETDAVSTKDQSAPSKGPPSHAVGSSPECNNYSYRDYSKELPPALVFPGGTDGTANPDPSAYIATPPGIKQQKLPTKLDAMLSDPSCQGIITWMPHGRAWKVLRPKEFLSQVIPRYFENTNYNSFVRLVNAWGFRRFSTGPDRHAYFHELFLRGKPHLHIQMRRLSRHETKTALDPKDEPDLYALEALQDVPPPAQAPTSAEALLPSTLIQSNLAHHARRMPNPNEPSIPAPPMTQGVEFNNLPPPPPPFESAPVSLRTPVREQWQLTQQPMKQQQQQEVPRPSEQARALQARIDHMKQLQHDLLFLEEEQQAQEQASAGHEAPPIELKTAQLPPHLRRAQLDLEHREAELRLERARLDLEAQRVELHKKEHQLQMQALRCEAQQGKPPLQKLSPQLPGAMRSNPGGLHYNRDTVMRNLRAHFFGIDASGLQSEDDSRQRAGYYSRGA